MRIFISWSGKNSKKIAEAFRIWLPGVLQTVKPYFTPNDIEKGNRWSKEIASELDKCAVGIFCITNENIGSPWIMFEAGAISKKVDQSLVCPILFGLKNSDISGPLTQFQTTLFEKQEVRALLKTINSANGENAIAEEVLNNVFEKWWPELETKVNAILSQEEGESAANIRDDREVLEEILDLARSLTKNQGIDSASRSNLKLNELLSSFLTNFDNVFHHDWEHTKISLGDSIPDYVISRSGTFIAPRIKDESNNWSSRGALLRSYRELIDFIQHGNLDISLDSW
jgi:hypothetical protein